MASYNLVLDTKFKPFSFEELIKTPLMETQAHQAIEEEYSNLSTKANVWEEMADEQSDPYAYRLYKTYANDLNNKANQLLEHGLDVSSRKSMLDMKSRYSKEITPIENAYKRREELAAEQRKAMMSNPTMMYQRYARDMSLDDFIRDPSADYGASYSGALLTQQVSQAASNIAKEISTPDGRRKIRKLLTENGRWLPYQYEAILQKGFTREDVDKAIRGDEDANPILTNIVNGVIDSSGISGWNNKETMDRARYFANQGLYSAIGTQDFSNIKDDYSASLALQRAKSERGSGSGFDPGKGRVPLNIVPFGLNNSKKGTSPTRRMSNNFSYKRDINDPITKIQLSILEKTYEAALKTGGDPVGIRNLETRINALKNPYSKGILDNARLIGGNNTGLTYDLTMYDNTGKLLTRDEFIKKNRYINPNSGIYDKTDKKTEEKLARYYDDEIRILAKYLDVSVKDLPSTYDEIQEAIGGVESGKGSGLVSAFDLMYSEDNINAAVKRIIGATSGEGDRLNVREIKGYTDDDNYDLGDRVKLKDIWDEEDDKLKHKDTSFVLTSLAGEPHLIMRAGGKAYDVPLTDLGSIATDTRLDTKALQKAQETINDINNRYGDEGTYEYIRSLVEQGSIPKGASEELKNLIIEVAANEATLKNSGFGFISQINTALLGNYKVSPFETSSQTGEYEPYTINLSNL